MQDKFNSIWNKFHKDLKYLVMLKISNKEDAQDVLQDIFVKIYKNIDYVDNIENLKAWVNKIATNTIIDYYKKAKINTTDIDILNIEDENIIDESYNHEISKCLNLFLHQLNKEDEDIINNAHFKKLKHKEIANEINISVANSKVKFSRAKKKLKNLLSECCEFQVDKYGNIVTYNQKTNCKCE